MKKLHSCTLIGIIALILLNYRTIYAQTGFGDNFNHSMLSCNWTPNTYTLTETGSDLLVNCAVAANTFNTFNLNIPTPINITSNPVLTIQIKSTSAISIRIDLTDGNGNSTNANPIVFNIPGNNTYATYTFNYTGLFTQSWPSSGTVNSSAISAVNIFVNPGGTAFNGSVYLDNLQLGSGGSTDGGASTCVVNSVAGFSSNIRLNQIGFYPNAPKTAIFKGTSSGNLFNVKSIDLSTTFFTNTFSGASTYPYSNESVQVANFSAFTTPGVYVLEIPGIGTSYTFNITNGVHAKVNKAALKAFYFNRSSTSIDAAYAGIYARAAGHPDNSIIILPSASSGARPAGTTLAAPKGWYDAADYNSYIVNAGIATYTLLSAYEQFVNYYDTLNLNIPESGNGIPDILSEIKWELDWMLQMQDPNDGGVYNKKTNANFDPFIMPSAATTPRYFCAKGTAAALDFAAVMATAYRIYLPYNSSFANTCLTAAVSAYNWANSNPNVPFNNPGASGGYPAVTTGGYGDNNFSDEFEWAATELYIATKNNTYYSKSFNNSNSYGVPDWADVRTLGLYSLLKNRKNLTSAAYGDTTNMKAKITSLAAPYNAFQQSSAYRIPMGGGGAGDFAWGSNAVAANQGMVLLQAYQLTKNISYYNAALAQLDYLLGRNPTTYCYVTGHGKNQVMNPHHRISYADGIVAPVPGLMAGGPQNGNNSDGCYNDPNPALAYVDAQPCFTKNEVAINWNAPFVFLSAGLEVLNPYLNITPNTPPSAAGTISGSNALCAGSSATFSIATVPGASSYFWSAPTNSTITGQGTGSINILFSTESGIVSVVPINSYGTGTGSNLAVTITNAPTTLGTISGITTACAAQSGLVYSVATLPGINNYFWSLPNGSSILQGNGTSTITVALGNNSGNIKVSPMNSCGTGTGNSLTLNINSIPNALGTINGLTQVCANQIGQPYSVATVAGATSYVWSISGASINIGNGSNMITINFNTTNATINVKPVNVCGTGTGSNMNILTNSYSIAGISIASSANPICSGTSINFTATTSNSGSSSLINWVKNGVNIGASGSTYSYIPSNNDKIQAVLSLTIPSGLCVSNTSSTSNGINLTVNPILTPTIGIIANKTIMCSGSTVSLTATGINGGSSPTIQWFKNGIPQATGSVYSYAPSNSDAIVATYTAGGNGTACIIGNPATSNGISLTVNSTLNASISIASNQTNVCSGSSVSLTATGINGGSLPTIQWFKNGVPQTTGPIYSYTPANGDAIKATYTAGGNGTACILGSPATSNGISLTVNYSLTPSITIAASQLAGCTGTSVTFTATGVNGGNAPVYQWQINGTNQGSATNSNLFSAIITSPNDLISVTLISNASCANPSEVHSNTITLTSIPNGTSPCLAPSTGSISGLNSIVANQTNVTYSVASISGTSYHWSVPIDATITSGQGTNSITVTFGTTGGNVGLITSNNYGTTNTTLVVNLVVTGIENTKTPFDILLYPNPFTNSINITFESAVSQPLQLNIYDTKGVEVEQKSGLSVGTYSIGESLSPGIYTAKISNGSEIKLIKLVKIN